MLLKGIPFFLYYGVNMFKKILFIFTVAILLTGCAAVDAILTDGSEQEDDQPWNTPSSWEGQGYGLPY